MANKNMVAEATEEDSAVAPARTGTLRRLLAKRRSDRKGALGSTEMVQLIGVILLIALLAGGTFVYLRFIRGSTENSIVQRNIDEVAKLADSYWQSYAADNDGRRKVDLNRFCQFANNQLAEDDLNLRTLQIVNANNGPPLSAAEIARLGGSPATIDMAGGVTATATQPPAGPSEAMCLPDPATGLPNIMATDEANAAGEVMDASTRTVWMAQYGRGGSLNSGTPAVKPSCANTDTTWDALDPATHIAPNCLSGFNGGSPASGYIFAPAGADTTHGGGVEVLVFGGLSPTGDSFCMIKVFDAGNSSEIGEYRVSRLSTDTSEFATCLLGYDGDGTVGAGCRKRPQQAPARRPVARASLIGSPDIETHRRRGSA